MSNEKEQVTKSTKIMRIVMIVLTVIVLGFGAMSALTPTKSAPSDYSQSYDNDF